MVSFGYCETVAQMPDASLTDALCQEMKNYPSSRGSQEGVPRMSRRRGPASLGHDGLLLPSSGSDIWRRRC